MYLLLPWVSGRPLCGEFPYKYSSIFLAKAPEELVNNISLGDLPLEIRTIQVLLPRAII